MKIIDKQDLKLSAKILFEGQILVFPTETSYGLGCDATNQEAVDKIFKIKKRSQDKPLLIVVSSLKMAKQYIKWDKNMENLANKYWPGPLTVVQKIIDNCSLAKGVISKNNTVAVRITNNEILLYLLQHLNKPIVATSANKAGEGEIYNSNKIKNIFRDEEFKPDAILDYGILAKNKPSTIVSVIGGEIKVLRQRGLETVAKLPKTVIARKEPVVCHCEEGTTEAISF